MWKSNTFSHKPKKDPSFCCVYSRQKAPAFKSPSVCVSACVCVSKESWWNWIQEEYIQTQSQKKSLSFFFFFFRLIRDLVETVQKEGCRIMEQVVPEIVLKYDGWKLFLLLTNLIYFFKMLMKPSWALKEHEIIFCDLSPRLNFEGVWDRA